MPADGVVLSAGEEVKAKLEFDAVDPVLEELSSNKKTRGNEASSREETLRDNAAVEEGSSPTVDSTATEARTPPITNGIDIAAAAVAGAASEAQEEKQADCESQSGCGEAPVEASTTSASASEDTVAALLRKPLESEKSTTGLLRSSSAGATMTTRRTSVDSFMSHRSNISPLVKEKKRRRWSLDKPTQLNLPQVSTSKGSSRQFHVDR